MKLINQPYFTPGHCTICRSGNRDEYVDTNVSYDFEGHLYICTKCVIEMANLIAYVPQLNLPPWLQGQIQEAMDGINRLGEQLNGHLANYTRHLSGISSSVAAVAERSEQYIQQQLVLIAAQGELPTSKGNSETDDSSADTSSGAGGDSDSEPSSKGLVTATNGPKLPKPSTEWPV